MFLNNFKKLLILMAFFMITKWWKFTTKKNSITLLIFTFKYSKKLNKVHNDFKD